MFELVKSLTDVNGRQFYEPYSMADVSFRVGVPPLSYPGVHRIRAYRSQAKAKGFNCLTGSIAYVSNRNINGFVELTLADGSPMHAYMQLMDTSGVSFPLHCGDSGTGGSSFIASSSCRVVYTPEWAKAARSDFVVYTLQCKRLVISGGVRKRIYN